MASNTVHSGWIFSRETDLAVFILPLLVAGVLQVIPGTGDLAQAVALTMLTLEIGFDRGHIFSTMVPLAHRAVDRKMPGSLLWLGPALIVMLVVWSVIFSSRAILTAVPFLALFHVFRQQWGWVMVSRRKGGEGLAGRRFDTLMIWNQMLVPILYWRSPMFIGPKHYYVVGDWTWSVDSSLVRFALAAHWLINFSYVAKIALNKFRGRRINAAKLFLIGVTWCWCYFGLVLIENRSFFFVTLVAMHGVPYMLYCHQRTRGTFGIMSSLQVRFQRWTRPSFHAAGVLLLSSLWFWMISQNYSDRHQWDVLIVAPGLLHYYYDAWLWRSPSTGQPTNVAIFDRLKANTEAKRAFLEVSP